MKFSVNYQGTLPKLIAGMICLALGSIPQLSIAQFDPEENGRITDIEPPDVIHWQAAGGRVYQDNVIEVGIRLFTEMEFTLYTDKVTFAAPGFKLLKIIAPTTQKLLDPISNSEVDVYAGGDFLLYFQSVDSYQSKSFKVSVNYLGCTTRICLFPYTDVVDVPVFATQKPSPLSNESDEAVSASNPESEDFAVSKKIEVEGSFEERWAEKVSKGEFSWIFLMVIVLLGGLATNLTPCVAPMLPITLRLLGNQKLPPLLSSSLYAFGIMVTYTALGSIAVLSGSAFGTFMQSSIVNVGFSLVMAMLGLSMLGFGDLSKLQNIGARIGSGKPSIKNTFLMGAGAGLVAAPCTGPVLGALLTYTAGQQNPNLGLLLMAVYSFGFALPYVLLGSAASKASTMRVPHYVQLFIKIGFGAVMFGLALYYLRVPLYAFVKIIKPYYGIISLTGLAAGTMIGIAWLINAKFHNNKFFMAIIAFVLGVGLFGGSQWITQSSNTELTWHRSKDEAFKVAASTGKPILMDNWAEWCEACKKMDVTTFVDQQVMDELAENWVLLKLDLTEGTEEDDAHMAEYGINGLPTLILLPSNGETEQARSIIGYVSAGGMLKHLNEFKGQ